MPDFLEPSQTFQIGIGKGAGIRVTPEHYHHSSWSASIVGRKRWILKPGTERQGDPVTELKPRATFLAKTGRALCEPSAAKPLDALVCDQDPGDVMWTPSFMWHETCSLDQWTIGVGGCSYF